MLATRFKVQNIPWPTDPIERVTVQYNMPDFLVRAWVDEYGVEATQELCHILRNASRLVK